MKHIAVNKISSIIADYEDPNFPVENLLDDKPKRRWSAGGGVSSATLDIEISGGCSDIAVFGTNARAITFEVSDPNEVSWGDGWGKNYIQNNRFKTLGAGGADVFAGWGETKTGSTVISQETSDVPDGVGYACKIEVAGTDSGSVRIDPLSMPISAGEVYRFRIWAKSTDALGIYVNVRIYNGSSTRYLDNYGTSWDTIPSSYYLPGVTSSWSLIEFDLPAIPSGFTTISRMSVGGGGSGVNTYFFTMVEIGNTGTASINDTTSPIAAVVSSDDEWGDGDEWANTDISSITGTVTQRQNTGALWISLSSAIARSCVARLYLLCAGNETLYAGVVTAMNAESYGDCNFRYGISEARADFSVQAQNSNGSRYYRKRDITRTFQTSALMLTTEFHRLMDYYDTYGAIPTAWKLTNADSTEWLVYAVAIPSGTHDHRIHSNVTVQFNEVI